MPVSREPQCHPCSSKIRKAVIPAAGFGTRMLPATKSIPKELLTIVDRPVLDYIVSRGVRRRHRARGHRHRPHEGGDRGSFRPRLRDRRIAAPQWQACASPRRLAKATPGVGAISFVRQQEARGLGHAVWTARHVIGDEPFAVLLPDMLMVEGEPCLKSLVDIHAPPWRQRRGGAEMPAGRGA